MRVWIIRTKKLLENLVVLIDGVMTSSLGKFIFEKGVTRAERGTMRA